MSQPDKSLLSRLFDLHNRDADVIRLLWPMAFAKGMGGVWLASVSSAFFLGYAGAVALSTVFAALGFAVATVSLLHDKKLQTQSPLRQARLVVFFLVVGTIALLTATGHWPGVQSARLAMFWRVLHWFMAEAVFWYVASRLIARDKRKNMIAVLITGDLIGRLLGGLAVPFVLQWLEPLSLMGFALAADLFWLAYLQAKQHLPILEEARARPARRVMPDSSRRVRSHPLIERHRFLLLQSLFLTVVLYCLVEYVFLGSVEQVLAAGKATTVFFGLFHASCAFVVMVFAYFARGWLARYGLTFATVSNPVLLLVGMGCAFAVLTATGLLWPVFWIVSATRVLQVALSETVIRPSYRLMGHPLPFWEDRRTTRLRRLVIVPCAFLTSGVLLYWLGSDIHSGLIVVSMVVIVLALASLLPKRLLHEVHVDVLKSVFDQHRWKGSELSVENRAAMNLLAEQLYRNNQRPHDIIYALHLLEKAGHPALGELLADQLISADPLVRRYVLERIEKYRFEGITEDVRECLRNDQSLQVRAQALRTCAALEKGSALETVTNYLSGEEPLLRRSAMVALLAYGGAEGILKAGSMIEKMAKDSSPAIRREAAVILGQAGLKSYFSPLLGLLEDEENNVVKAALQAAGEICHPDLLPAVIGRVNHPLLYGQAVQAVAKFKKDALPEIARILHQTNTPLAIKERLIRGVGRMPADTCSEFLFSRLDLPSVGLRRVVLQVLRTRQIALPEKGRPLIRSALYTEGEHAAAILACLTDVCGREDDGDEIVKSLKNALEEKLAETRLHIVYLLSLVSRRQDFYADALALEKTTDNALREKLMVKIVAGIPADLGVFYVPLFERKPYYEMLRQLKPHFPVPALGLRRRLSKLAVEGWAGPWVRTLAIDAALNYEPDESLKPTFFRALRDNYSVVRQTALLALQKLVAQGPADKVEEWMQTHIAPLIADDSEAVRNTARQILETSGLPVTLPEPKPKSDI